MTATAPAHSARTDRLRALLLVDGVGTAALGVGALGAAEPLADVVGTPAALRWVGVLFLVLGADMLLVRGWSGRRLTAGAVALGAADLVFAAAVVAAVAVGGASSTGTALVLALAGVCVVMGGAKLALARTAG